MTRTTWLLIAACFLAPAACDEPSRSPSASQAGDTVERASDGSATDGQILADGAIVGPDGAIVGPDGAIVGPDGAVCFPDCAGRECGDNGCGGSCGKCTAPETCHADGLCHGCIPDCEGRECGDDGCGGSCGACADWTGTKRDWLCKDGACCEQQCAGVCGGDDGCGGACPKACQVGYDCDEDTDACVSPAVCGPSPEPPQCAAVAPAPTTAAWNSQAWAGLTCLNDNAWAMM